MAAQAVHGRRGVHPRSLASDTSARLPPLLPVEFSPRCFQISQKARALLCLSQIPLRPAAPSLECLQRADAFPIEKAPHSNSFPPCSLVQKACALPNSREPHFPPPCKSGAPDT